MKASSLAPIAEEPGVTPLAFHDTKVAIEMASQKKPTPVTSGLMERPVGIASGVLGAGFNHSLERPKLVDKAPVKRSASLTPAHELAAEGTELAQHVKTILHTSLDELPSTNERPQRSWGMRAVDGIPLVGGFFKSKTALELLRDTTSGQPETAGAAGPKAPKHASPEQLAQASQRGITDPVPRQKHLLLTLKDSAQAHKAAAENHRQASEVLKSAPANDPARAMLQAAHDSTHRQLQEATEALHTAVSLTTLLETNIHVLASDLIQQKIAFVHTQVSNSQAALEQTRSGIEEVVRNLNQQHGDVQEIAQLASVALGDAGVHHAALEQMLADLKHELPTLRHQARDAHETVSGEPASDRLSRLEDMQTTLQQALTQSAADLEQRWGAVEDAQQSLKTFEAYFNQEIKGLDALSHEVTQGLKALKEPGGQVAEKADTADHKQQKVRELERQLHYEAALGMARIAPGFDPATLSTPQGQELTAQLTRLVRLLPADNLEEKRALPRLAVMELLSRGLSGASNGDLPAANELLKQLTAHPLEHWMAPPEGHASLTHAAPSEAMNRLLRGMANVPRGSEVLNRVAGAGSGKGELAQPQLDAVQAYWIADQARTQESSEDVKAWLGKAMDVARHEVRNTKDNQRFDIAELPLKDQAAFNAVKNGFLSNAPGSDYDYNNQNLLKLSDDWVKSAQDHRSAPLRWLPKSISPSKDKSPFMPEALRMINRQMESQGMDTTKTQARDSIMNTAQALGQQAKAGLMRPADGSAAPPGAPRFDATVQALCDHILAHKAQPTAISRVTNNVHKLGHKAFRSSGHEPVPSFDKTKRIYDAHLSGKDIAAIRRAVQDLLPQPEAAPGRRRLTKPNPNQRVELPPEFEALFKKDSVPVTEVLKTIQKALAASPGAHEGPVAGALDLLAKDFAVSVDGKSGIDTKVRNAKLRTFETKEDIISFFSPTLQGMQLRDQIGIAGGGTAGIGLPFIPWAPVPPLIVGASVNLYAKRDEAFVQFKTPSFGVEVAMGETTTRSHDIKGTLGFGASAGIFKFSAPTGSLKYEHSQSHTGSTTLRTLTEKDDKGLRKLDHALNARLELLDTMIRWDAADKQPKPGEGQFAGPMEAVLALHPNVMVSSGTRDSTSHQVGVDLALASRIGFGDGVMSAGFTANPLIAKFEKTTETGSENTGYAHQTIKDSSDQRRQRLSSALSFSGIATLFKQPVDPDSAGAGLLRVNGAATLFDISRELASNLEKNDTTRFSIGDLSGGSVDRSYGSPKDLLAEINKHPEEFLMRGLESLPHGEGEAVDTPDRRAFAKGMLKDMVAELEAAKKHPSLQYNIKYETHPRVNILIDALRGVEAQARQCGNLEEAAQAVEAQKNLASSRASWTVKNVSIRSKGKDSSEYGVDFFARWQKVYTTDTNRTLKSFPN